ncbi:hypothetical protein JHK84_039508 [Glycine max]|nr:hypothetical protein JHK86_039279 [Glycine max]KAG5121168.1 hypothetical protein JHK84_039508 [Glycine max]
MAGQIETRNNNLEMQSVNNKSLIEELDKLLERLRVPSEYATNLTGGSFDEARMLQNVEACEWLTSALRGLGVPNLDPSYANMRTVKEKRAELEKLKSTFVRRASEFLRNYFASLVDLMISDKSYFSQEFIGITFSSSSEQRGQLKRPDHADLRYKCRTYARLLQHLKSLDKNCLGPLRKAYCSSLNLLLRREMASAAPSSSLLKPITLATDLVFSDPLLSAMPREANSSISTSFSPSPIAIICT